MKLPCSVIQDLLPLYAEGLTNEENRALVEAHLPECETCRRTLEDLTAPKPPVADSGEVPLLLVKKMLQKQTIAWVLAAVCAMSLVFLVLTGWITHAQPLPYGAGEFRCWSADDGTYVRFTAPSAQYLDFDVYLYTDPYGNRCAELTAYTSPWLQLSGSDSRDWASRVKLSEELLDNIYYCDRADGGTLHLLYGTLEPYEEIPGASLPRLALNYYFFAALFLAAGFGLLALVLRKSAHGTTLGHVALGFACYGAAHLLIKGGSGSSFFLLQDLVFILLTAMALFGLFKGIWMLWSLHRTL